MSVQHGENSSYLKGCLEVDHEKSSSQSSVSKIRQQQSDRKQSYNENENTARFQIQKQQATYQEYGKFFKHKITFINFSSLKLISLTSNMVLRLNLSKTIYNLTSIIFNSEWNLIVLKQMICYINENDIK